MNWNLSKLYTGYDDPRMAEDAKYVLDTSLKLRDRIAEAPDADALAAIILELDKLDDTFGMLAAYTMLTLSVDAENEEAGAYYAKIDDLSIEYSQVHSALSRYIGGIKDLDALIASNETLRSHAYAVRNYARSAAHTISPEMEPIVLKMQATGGSSWEKLRNDLDAGLSITLELNGETKTLPLSAVRALAYSADPEERRRGYEAELAAYPRIEVPMAACLNGIKGEALTLASLEHYDSVLDTALDISRMDRATLDALISSLYDSLPMFRRYFRLKAKLLGYEGGLKFYDLCAPVGESNLRYTLDEAREMLHTVMGRFSPKMAAFIDHAFEDHWIDVYPREGKQGGAFCDGVHAKKMSYVMCNFDGSYNSVSTFAHELGHGYHNSCLKDVPALLADYPMPLAETASTFNEVMLLEKTLETADEQTKLTLLDQQLSDAAQVIVDILSRYIFETEVVERRKDHMMSPKELCAIMLDAQKQTYGDGLDPECLHPYMWACKSHYYSTGVHFYNFPYAFGLLFGLGIYARYQARGETFLPEYDKLLRLTGSADIREVAASIGIDVADKAFWQSSLKTLERKIDAFEKLVG